MYCAECQQVVKSGYTQEVRWVNTPLCKGSTEMVQVIYTKGEKTKSSIQKVKKPRDGRRFQNYRKGFYLCIDRTSSPS